MGRLTWRFFLFRGEATAGASTTCASTVSSCGATYLLLGNFLPRLLDRRDRWALLFGFVHLSLPLLTVLEERLVLVKPLTEGALLGDLKASATRISPCYIRVLHAQEFLLMRADQGTGVTAPEVNSVVAR